MKYSFSFLFLFSLIANLRAAPLIVLSGEKTPLQKRVLKSLIEEEYPSLKDFILEEGENKKCKKVEGALLQLCFLEGKIIVLTSRRERLKKTIHRMMILEEQTEKPFSREGSLPKI